MSSDRRKRTGRWGSCTETGRDRSGINLTILMPRTRTITLTMLVNCSETVDYLVANVPYNHWRIYFQNNIRSKEGRTSSGCDVIKGTNQIKQVALSNDRVKLG